MQRVHYAILMEGRSYACEGKMQEHATHWTRALVTQARANLGGHARLHQVVFDRGFGSCVASVL